MLILSDAIEKVVRNDEWNDMFGTRSFTLSKTNIGRTLKIIDHVHFVRIIIHVQYTKVNILIHILIRMYLMKFKFKQKFKGIEGNYKSIHDI